MEDNNTAGVITLSEKFRHSLASELAGRRRGAQMKAFSIQYHKFKLATMLAVHLTTLLLVIAAASAADSSYRNNYDSHIALDEEISLDSRAYDYDNKLPAAGHPDKSTDQQTQQQSDGGSQDIDPFAFTFEDYLKDNSNNNRAGNKTAPRRGERPEITNQQQRQQPINNKESLTHNASHNQHHQSSPDPVGLVIEDEDDNLVLGKPKESQIIDYVFPPPAQAADSPASSRHQATHEKSIRDESLLNQKEISEAVELVNEIKLLFSWKSLATSKCSKTCGKGFRLNHISCIDLKYNVSVESELCTRANIRRPSEISEDPCNEIDCPPEWTSVETKECNPSDGRGDCRNQNSFKRVRCMQVNRHGDTVQLDDSKCSFSDQQSTSSAAVREEVAYRPEIMDEYNVDVGAASEDKSNDVFPAQVEHGEHSIFGSTKSSHSRSSTLSEGQLHGNQHHQNHLNNEPFYEPGPWSDCVRNRPSSAAAESQSCGQLGVRHRKLHCRLYLARSAKFADLPESGCHNLNAPHIEEPCYIDCPPVIESELNITQQQQEDKFGENSPTSGAESAPARSLDSLNPEDEIVYDLEMRRYIWKQGGWTKCSADCLGGQRESIIECWDKVAESFVESNLCELHDSQKPEVITETCNYIACSPEWKVEEFSQCSRNCGSAGIRTRTVTCVQQVPGDARPHYAAASADGTTTSSYLRVVPNDLCSITTMPHRMEPCNRVDCKPEWSVGPWSECSRKCGEGIRNRTIICLQEFANREGPRLDSSYKYPFKLPNPDLIEAVALSAKNWHPGKLTQVPFHECYEEYRTIPPLDEKCYLQPCRLVKDSLIDADQKQNYIVTHEAMKRKTVSLKIGGRAQIPVGKNVKIRCRIMSRLTKESLTIGKKFPRDLIEWTFDGIRVFSNGSKVVERQEIYDDNSILQGKEADDLFNDQVADKDLPMMADYPGTGGAPKAAAAQSAGQLPTTLITTTQKPTTTTSEGHSKSRNLMTRSWNERSQGQSMFVPMKGGRFSLVKDNTLRIKRLRPNDSGTYTCSFGTLSESLELRVTNQLAPIKSTGASLESDKTFASNNLGSI